MRRDQRQTGSARSPKPTKMESVWAARGQVQPGPLRWDLSMPDVRKPTNRELRRSFGTGIGAQKRS